ncbi:MAG: MerR family transcriptional regulator [Candidatus Methylomirabilia bacterium]
MTDKAKPLYTIGVVAGMLKLHPQTLRLYERKGLIKPSRTEGRMRMYSAEDVEEIARVVRLMRDLGVNLAGAEIILKMRSQMLKMQQQIGELLAYVREERIRTGDRGQQETREALVRAASGQLAPIDLF